MSTIRVQIIPSVALQQLRLAELVWRTAVILEPIESPNGCWVRLEGHPYLDWSDWYIPYESIVLLIGDKCVASTDQLNKEWEH